MKKTLTILLLIVTILTFGQSQILTKYQTADSLVQAENYNEAYKILK